MKKWLTHQEDLTIINIYASNNRTKMFIKRYLTESKGDRQLEISILHFE